MRVLGVVTLVSPLGEYGGPTRVALNQLAALQARGHEVLLIGGQRGFGTVPEHIDGVPVRLFPVRSVVPGTGFAGLAAPSLWRAVRRLAPAYDVVHVHAARDLITLPAARIAQRTGVPVVLQTHGMIDESRHPLSRPLDAVLTRPALRRARAVMHLTTTERDSLTAVGRGAVRLVELGNGVPTDAEPAAPAGPHVLYLARLAARKRPAMFVSAAATLAAEFPAARFTLVGPDEGEGTAVRDAIAAADAGDRVAWVGPAPMSETAAHLRAASAFVLPAVDEPYPMAVLEAMALGLPVVVTETCGLADFIAEHDAGIVVDPSQDALTRAVRALLADPAAAAGQGRRGRAAVRAERSMDAVASCLERVYAQ